MTDMSSTDHYDAAEKLLEEAESYREPDTRASAAPVGDSMLAQHAHDGRRV
jgi:hypothetical protein